MIYGIGSKSLSEALGVTIDEAKEFKESFINRFSNIKKLINETHDKCRENGFVTTMNGRRRYLPKIHSSSSKTIAEGERQAVNSTIQGSAADVLKLALVSVQKMIMDNQDSIQARFILQMHDEIMCEVDESNVDTFVSMMRERMESCGRKFYLPVKVKVGPNWGDLEERE
jgi:DNA polymerase I-like protein with 3'-5' exonuclease and polymerase domains